MNTTPQKLCAPALPSRRIVSIRVDAISYSDATRCILDWARRGGSRYVCVAGVHTVMESCDSAEFRDLVNRADLVTPDGMPLVWGLRLQGCRDATRVYGPDLTLRVMPEAARESVAVGFYGGSEPILTRLVDRLKHSFPGLRVAYSYSPPFRPLTREEDDRIVDEIAKSETKILFVGLGCPKQERWMAEHHGRIPAVMIGVGAAFDFLAGAKKQAPCWMQDHGLEWLFRLLSEPRRLWRRYLFNNPRFLVLFAGQLWKERRQ
jgi:N-acetylglucosaminyldiphosphoundecaprenol N-acetyl-beta-D-mannosaminyltransferase